MGEYILGKVKRFYSNHPRQENIIRIFQQGVDPGATPGANRVKFSFRHDTYFRFYLVFVHYPVRCGPCNIFQTTEDINKAISLIARSSI